MNFRGENRKGQVTIFIILAIIFVVGAIGFFVFKDSIISSSTSETFLPLQSDFLNCVKLQASNGIQILETKGGYLKSPKFVPGSRYIPFSSELNFVGTKIPYWSFISGNNLPYEQVPSRRDLEKRLKEYLEDEIPACSFKKYISEGYFVKKGVPTISIKIEKDVIRISLKMDLTFQKGNESVFLEDYKIDVNSQLGSLYEDAIKFYNQEKEEMFLENYSVDILRLYAPVDGVELTCSPKIWDAKKVFEDLRDATEVNFLSLNNNGDKKDYFNLNLNLDSDLRIINSKNWPNTYEINPSNSQILIAKPLGNQEGLGVLGFCYVPYHFVYDLKYPLLIRLTQGEETFQFPLAIVIDKNVPRKSVGEKSIKSLERNVCNDKSSEVSISLIDSDSNPIEANISYECFGSSCAIGRTKNGEITTLFPQCVNGNVIIEKEGYKRSSTMFTSLNGGSLNIFLEKEYEKSFVLSSQGQVLEDRAIVNFISSDSTKTILYPNQKSVNLSAGNYEIKVYVYRNSSLTFPETTRRQCYDVPSSWVGGILGLNSRECTDIEIPKQEVSNLLIGGGTVEYLFKETNLKNKLKLELDIGTLVVPNSLEGVQLNYALFDARKIGVMFR